MVPSPSASSPNVAMPTTRTRTGVGTCTVVVSPTCRSPSFAAPRLITTSFAVRGARPSARRYWLSRLSVVHEPASVGGPLPPIAFPSAPIRRP